MRPTAFSTLALRRLLLHTSSHNRSVTAAAVGAYIGAAYFFTSSTSFANPAVTIGRSLTDTFSGIAPESVPMFIVFQVVGAAIGALLTEFFYPRPGAAEPLDLPDPVHHGPHPSD